SSNPVSCTLSHVSLEAAPAYTALSYNWGDTAQRVGILVNGATIMVTLNLEAALRHLRLQDKPLTLWVDFLCIDQSDEVEKSEQLEQMRQIYVQALSVVAWLGPAESNSDAALHWIQQYDLKKDLSPTSLENADIINALSRLFTRPYWSRVWVIQEL
ncbi:heterokaryon incompatibility, partial [Leptodontidium sp. 2 PMI_412]